MKGYLDKLEEVCPQELLTLEEEVNPGAFEATAVLRRLEMAAKYPLVVFRRPLNLKGQVSEFPLVMNVFADRARCALALGMRWEDSKLALAIEYGRREAGVCRPEMIPKSSALVKQVVKVGDQADLRDLPIARHHEMDLAPYIDMAVILRDPESKAHNTAFLRTAYKGPRRLGLHMARRHSREIVRRHEAAGKNTPVVIVVCHHPAFFLGTLNSVPFDTDDYEVIGSIMGESVRLTASETWGEDFLVPADADLLIEGEVLAGCREVEGPFGENHGYSGPQGLGWVIEVKAITHRHGACYQSIFVGHADNWMLGAIPREGAIYQRIQASMPNVRGVHLANSGCGRHNCYISLKQSVAGQGKQAALIALATADFIKNVVVVDEDIDPYNEQEVWWAIATRAQPEEDVDILRGVSYNAPDPSTKEEGVGSKMIIDATMPVGRPFDRRSTVPEAALIRAEALLKGRI
jgi:UbiD family decarboxylase